MTRRVPHYCPGGVTLAELDEGAVRLIPADNYKQCIGTLTIEFTVAGGQGEYPGLFINSQTMDDAATYVNGELLSGNLKSYYIYKLDYYPLLFDLCTALLLFGRVFPDRTEKRQCGGNLPAVGAEKQERGGIPCAGQQSDVHTDRF